MFREQDRTRLAPKAALLYIFGFIIFSLLLFKAWYLQVQTGTEYYSRSQANSIRIVEVIPSRGLIYANNNDIIVDNRPAFSLAILPVEISDSTLKKVIKIIGIELEGVQKKIRRANKYRPLIIKRQIDDSLRIYFEENLHFYPGISIQIEPKRYYTRPKIIPHVLGYISEVDDKTVASSSIYESGDIVGKSGLEYVYDLDLRGKKGFRYIRVDVRGREVGELYSKFVTPVAAKDLHLTLVRKLQEFAESELIDKRGVVVAINARNGGIIAMASKPDYDPDLFAEIISPEKWTELVNNPDKPLTHRAVQGIYPPGSTYKIVSSVLATDLKIVSPKWSIVCNGFMRIGRKTMECWNHKGHGEMAMLDAIKGSCNVYFYNLSLKIDLTTYADYSRRFMFGQKTGIDITGENSGLIPSYEFYEKRIGKGGFTKGYMANLVIGQGEVLTTPLQIAQFAMILGNNGEYFQPHFIDYLVDVEKGDTLRFQPIKRKIRIPTKSLQLSRRGMKEVVHGGTASNVALMDLVIAGKTGTAENPHGDPHSWFMGFAPYDNPEIAIAVLIENGGGGSMVAAPIARRFLEMYFYGDISWERRLYKPKPKEEVDDLLDLLIIEPLLTE